MSTAKIFIDPTSRILYASYYISGLYEVFNQKNVVFNKSYFTDLKRNMELFSFNHFFAFVHIENEILTRFVIDFCDSNDISQEAYDWCDVYAKINYNRPEEDVFKKKIILIPPSFGIKIWSLTTTLKNAISNFIVSNKVIPTSKREFFKDYWSQFRRLPLNQYCNKTNSDPDYVFMLGTLWQQNDEVKNTNVFRTTFIKSCLANKKIVFEGGLVANETLQKQNANINDVFSKKYSLSQYISNTKRSGFVFNTPAVHECHGWKLAEFLALGKTILSTPLSNELPAPLRHGKEIHIIGDIDKMNSDIAYLHENQTYSLMLAAGAKNYFNKHATPSVVIKSILKKANICL